MLKENGMALSDLPLASVGDVGVAEPYTAAILECPALDAGLLLAVGVGGIRCG